MVKKTNQNFVSSPGTPLNSQTFSDEMAERDRGFQSQAGANTGSTTGMEPTYTFDMPKEPVPAPFQARGLERDITTRPEDFSFLVGTPEEQWRQSAGLALGSQIYGTNLQNIGQNAQEIERMLRQRVQGNDPQSEIIRAQKSGALATAGRQMRAGGAGGMQAALATEALGRKQDYQIADSLYGQQASALQDYRNFIGNQISGIISLGYGEKSLAE